METVLEKMINYRSTFIILEPDHAITGNAQC